MSKIIELIKKIPKAELHLHIEGSLEPELMFELGKRNKIEIPFKSVDEIRSAYNFHDLQSFLDIYYQGSNVLKADSSSRCLKKHMIIFELIPNSFSAFRRAL